MNIIARNIRYSVRGLGVLVAFILYSGMASGDDVSDHERARAAVESGDVVPLAQILEKVESMYQGSIIEVELEDEDDEGHQADDDNGQEDDPYLRGFIYEIKLLTPQGNLLKLEMDARNGQLIQVRGQGEEQARKKIPIPEQEQEP